MPRDDALPTLKILLIGPSGVGKTALLTRYCDDEFEPDLSSATIGIDFKAKRVSVRGKPYRLNLFDTAGQDRFRTLSTSFYRGAHGVLLVYDISNRASFRSLDRWFAEARANTVPEAVLYLVGGKLDRPRAVSADEGAALAAAHGTRFCESSAATGEGVRRPFVELVDAIVKSPGLVPARGPGRAVGAGVGVGGDGRPAAAWGSGYCSC